MNSKKIVHGFYNLKKKLMLLFIMVIIFKIHC